MTMIQAQQARQTPAAQPPIPALPSRPGEATGAGPAPGATTGAGGGSDVRISLPGDASSLSDAIEAQIRDAIRQSQSSTGVPAPSREPDIPPEVIPLVGMSLGLVVAMVVGYPIARAIGRVIERRGDKGVVRAADVAPQLRQLQESVDAMAIELERIGEAQRFSARLMAQKSPPLPGSSAPPA